MIGMADRRNNRGLSLTVSPENRPYDVEEARLWLRDHRIEEVECVAPDFGGVPRGKAMPCAKFAEMKPIYMPVSIFFQTITGMYVEFEDQAVWAEHDLRLIPDLSTMRAVPWALEPSVQVIHDLVDKKGQAVPFAPREVLRRVLKLYAERGWRPVVAPELEFYLTKRNTDPDYPLEPPIGRTGRQGMGNQAYSISAVDEYDSVIEHIYDYAEAQGLEIDTVIQEAGAGQIEMNLIHGDPMDLADQVFMFKRTIREAALRHDCYATFMAKPMEGQPGSAMHIHQSVVDAKTGRNIFTDASDAPTPEFYHFIGGQQKYLAATGCVFAPYVNSYRRLTPDMAAPVNLEWGEDNRTAGLRVPISGPEARRVETRVVGADANPYLSLAVCLACGYLGLRDAVEARPVLEGNAYSGQHELPHGLLEAVSLFESTPELREVLSPEFCDLYARVKRAEYNEYMRVISPWEREYLLLTV